jgi:glycosyltransferase involved in cell wall biosynthesis
MESFWNNMKVYRDKKQLTLAFVTDAIYPYSKGGKEKRLYDVVKILAKQGCRIDVYTMKWWNGPDVIVRNGIFYHALCRNYRLYVGSRRSIKQGVIFGLSCLKLLKTNFDIVDVDQIPLFPIYSLWLVCLLRGKKLFVTWHEVWGKEYWELYLGRRGAIAAVLERVAAKLPNTIIAVSESTALQLWVTLLRKKNVIVIPNTVNFDEISKIKSSRRKQDIIFAARLLKHKRADILVKAIAILKKTNPKISCLIVGTGPEEVRVKQLTSKMGLTKNVYFHDFYDNIADLYSAIKSSKVYVAPSEREGFGLGLLEANACGVPAITFDSPHNAARLLIEEETNGSVISPSVEALAVSIEYWLNHEPTNTRIPVASYDSALTFSKLIEAYVL